MAPSDSQSAAIQRDTSSSTAGTPSTQSVSKIENVPLELQERLRMMEIQLYLAVQDKANLECKMQMLSEENRHLKTAVETKVENTAINFFAPYESKVRDIINYYDTTEHGYSSDVDENEVDREVDAMMRELISDDEADEETFDMGDDSNPPSSVATDDQDLPYDIVKKYNLNKERSVSIVLGDATEDRALDSIAITGTPVLVGRGAYSNRIEEAAGETVTQDCEEHIDDVGLCEPSTVYITKTPGKLVQLRGVIYAVASETLINSFKLEQHLKKLIQNLMSSAEDRDISSIGFGPLVSEAYGIGERLIPEAGAKIFEEIQLYFDEHPNSCIQDIRFFCDENREAEILKDALDPKFKAPVASRERVSSRVNAKHLESLFSNGKPPVARTMSMSMGGAAGIQKEQERKPKEEDTKQKELNPREYYAVPLESLTYREDADTDATIEFDENLDSNGDKVIKCATVHKLVERVTHHDLFDNNFLYAFMLTYRSFTTPQELLEMLIERYNIPPPDLYDKQKFAEFKKTKLDKVRLRVLQVLKHWMERHKYDFDDALITSIETFISTHIEGTKSKNSASFIRRSLSKLKEDQSKGPTTFAEAPPKPLLPSLRVFRSDIQLMDWPSKEIARQITIIEFELFQKIHPKEFLNQSWNKEKWETQARNVYAMIQRFNNVSRWCATLILAEETPKKRARTLAKFINIAECCRQLNNFNAIFEIISSLNSAAIHRLKKTWDMVSFKDKELYKALHDLISRDGNFRALREAMENVDPPSIPYIGRYLSDLTFIEDGNPDKLNGKVNFIKRKQLATLIRDLQTHQQTPFNLEPVKQLQEELRDLQYKEEKQLYALSVEREERKKKKRKATTKK